LSGDILHLALAIFNLLIQLLNLRRGLVIGHTVRKRRGL
jgi:hypothetical protein